MPTACYTALGASIRAGKMSGLCMLGGDTDDVDGAVRLVFKSADRGRYTATVGRWLAVVRVGPGVRRGTRLLWLLDASTASWSGGQVPVDLHHGATGLDSEANPVLWFHAACAGTGLTMRRIRKLTARWVFRVAGVFGAAGIIDGASVRISRRLLSGRARLRITVRTEMWDLTGYSPEDTASRIVRSAPSLTIAAEGVLRPLDLAAVREWL